MKKARFFETPAALRAWLRTNHDKATELLVSFFKSHTGKPSLTWPESVAEALCYGWIDGVRRRIDNDRYTIRFTPRRKRSKWSAVNIRMMAALENSGRMTEAGRAAFKGRPNPESKGYSAQKKDGTLDEARLREFKKNRPAWVFFEAQAPSYRRAAAWWVMSAKQEKTSDGRFARLVKSSAVSKRLG
jgi:uncharacterized protein YdeI (YjbR/CyaY-like superfamily)